MKRLFSFPIILLSLFFITIQPIYGQSVNGQIRDTEGPLAGATVHWAGTNVGISADGEGRFTLHRVRNYDLLVASYLGYISDTIRITDNSFLDIVLHPDATELETVVVTGRERGNYISARSFAKTENISFGGLIKMACCNLAESFENSASVTVGYSDAVSGARQIRMLGMAGIYSQLLDETRPVMRGLGATYGLSYTPGMWLSGIQLSKGPSSVVNGHEAISGQINLEHRKPTDEEKLFVNGYLDEQLRTELNVASSQQISDKLSTVILAHGSIDDLKIDDNHDGFLDLPTLRQINVANRWLYVADNGMQLRAGVKLVEERRKGGQKDFKKSLHRGGTEKYGSQIDNRNLSAYLKVALPLGRSVFNEDTQEELRSNLAVIADYSYYEQKSFFGIKDYEGRQYSGYINFLYNLYLHKNHLVVFGATGLIDDYNENLIDRYTDGRYSTGGYIIRQNMLPFSRTEREAGLFGEYTFNYGDKFTLIAGLRADYNDHYRWFFTPRGHFRWELTPGWVLRGSAGKGFRSANLITDNIGMLATGRRIRIQEGIDRLEEALTYGGSLTWTFRLGNDPSASLSLDYFHNRFYNQVVADQEYDSREIFVYSTGKKSYTNTWQADFTWSPFERFEVFLTYRYNDTQGSLHRKDGSSEKVSKPLIDDFKTLANLQYATRFRKWVFDFTAQVNGQSRLPVQNGQLERFQYSPVYPLFFAQVTRKFRKFDVYLGCENIGNYTQEHPVLSPGTPFEPSFNSSVVWGPLMGRKIYAGFRYSL